MTKKETAKALEILLGFKKRAEKLSEKAKEWEVNTNLNKIMKKMSIPLEFSGGGELSKKGKIKLIQSIRYKLDVLRDHFSSVYHTIQKNPMIWDKKIESNEKKIGKRISFYEKIIQILFRKKTEKK